MASRKYFGLESITQYESQAIVQRVVSYLCSEGRETSLFASLSQALDIPEETLQREFGTEQALVETIWEAWPQIVLAALSEPLRNETTGREAVSGLLETAISLQSGYRRLKELRNSNRPAAIGVRCEGQAVQTCLWKLERQIRERFKRSVYEGELPEDSRVLSLSALCLRLVGGFLAGVEDEVFAATASDSVNLFVDRLGFHVARPLKRRRRLTPVLPFVKKSPAL